MCTLKANRLGLWCLLPTLACCASCGGGGGGPTGRWSEGDFFTDQDMVALARAAGRGDVEKIDDLVAQGVNVNATGKDNMTPLLWSLWAKNKEGFKRLLEHGADPNVIVKDGHSVMEFAALHEDPDYLKMVLARKGDPDLVHPRLKRTPIFFAVQGRHKENLDLLIEAGANLDHQDSSRITPMMYADTKKQYDYVYYLLDAGADYTVKDLVGHTIAHHVLEFPFRLEEEQSQWRTKVIDFLKKEGVDLEPIEQWAKQRREKREKHRKDFMRQMRE